MASQPDFECHEAQPQLDSLDQSVFPFRSGRLLTSILKKNSIRDEQRRPASERGSDPSLPSLPYPTSTTCPSMGKWTRVASTGRFVAASTASL